MDYTNPNDFKTSETYFIFSRVDIDKTFGSKKGLIPKYQPISGGFELQKIFDNNNLNEQESYISCYLSLLSQGQISPKSKSISDRDWEFEFDKDLEILNIIENLLVVVF